MMIPDEVQGCDSPLCTRRSRPFPTYDNWQRSARNQLLDRTGHKDPCWTKPPGGPSQSPAGRSCRSGPRPGKDWGGAMTFPHTTSSRNPPRVLDLVVLVAIAALPMAGARPPSGAAVFAVVMVPVGFLLWWLPWLGGRGRWPDLLILPAFMTLTLFYLFLAILA